MVPNLVVLILVPANGNVHDSSLKNDILKSLTMLWVVQESTNILDFRAMYHYVSLISTFFHICSRFHVMLGACPLFFSSSVVYGSSPSHVRAFHWWIRLCGTLAGEEWSPNWERIQSRNLKQTLHLVVASYQSRLRHILANKSIIIDITL